MENINPIVNQVQEHINDDAKTSHDAMPFVEQQNHDLLFNQNQDEIKNKYIFHNLVDKKLPLQVKVRRSSAPVCPVAGRAYPMRSFPRGAALIINNKEFEDEARRRLGAQVDGASLHHLLTQLGFNVILRNDLSHNNMIKEIRAFSQLASHEEADMSIICILTHGDDGILESTDGAYIKKEWVLEQFNNENCPALRGKPKFFILQSCSGVQKDYGVATQDRITSTDALPVNETGEPILVKRSVTWEDILIANATVPGYVSYRNHNWGSWFIECICQVFMQQAADTDIEEMLKNVAVRLSEYESEFGTKQSFEWANRNFYKKLYFNPGWICDKNGWKPCQGDDTSSIISATKELDQSNIDFNDDANCAEVVKCEDNIDEDDLIYIPKANMEQIDKLIGQLSTLEHENRFLKKCTYISAAMFIVILSICFLQLNNQLTQLKNFLNFTDV